MSNKDYEYFKSHLSGLLKKYKGKFLVIKDEAVVGAYFSFDEAYNDAVNTLAPGSFIIQQCVKDENNTASFMSNNVTFA